MFAKTADVSGASARLQETALYNSQGSLLAADLIIVGEISSTGSIEVHGQIEGSLSAGAVTITQSGKVNGTITAQDLEIRGQVEGNATCTRLIVQPEANVRTDISCQSLLIEAGAVIEGRITMAR